MKFTSNWAFRIAAAGSPTGWLSVAFALVLLHGVPGVQGAKPASQCVECHQQLEGSLAAPVKALQADIHLQRGLSCDSCHGGNPAESDPAEAMSPAKGFIGKPSGASVAGFCGRCHSDASLMKRYNPGLRVDQQVEYLTSVHGQRVQEGDAHVATCVSCHGVHGIRPVSDPTSPVYPTNVAATCGKCHGNADYMKEYSIPTDQLTLYRSSVHGKALFEENDLSAPTCNDCHGNHGATPPGVTSVVHVCGACHTRQNDLFQKSPHAAAFRDAGLAGCIACHSNHAIHQPSEAMLGVGEASTCVNCHTEGETAYRTASDMKGGIDSMISELNAAERLVSTARRAGMEVSRAEFDLKEAHDSLINARVLTHSFTASALEAELRSGREIIRKASREGREALNELQFRRKGLATSLLLIGLALAAVFLKIRKIERPKD